MRHALHTTEWKALQGICDDLVRTEGIVWAGVTEAEAEPRWLAFSGSADDAPLDPERDQFFEQAFLDAPPASAIVMLSPRRPRRDYVCGLLFPAGLTLVAVPDPARADALPVVSQALRSALVRLRDSLPVGGLPPRGAPPRPPPPAGPAHAWDWIPIPGARKKP